MKKSGGEMNDRDETGFPGIVSAIRRGLELLLSRVGTWDVGWHSGNILTGKERLKSSYSD